jgi:hypothetical protein
MVFLDSEVDGIPGQFYSWTVLFEDEPTVLVIWSWLSL